MNSKQHNPHKKQARCIIHLSRSMAIKQGLKLLLLCSFLSFSGCVSLHVDQQKTFQQHNKAQRLKRRQQLQRWDIQGAFSISQPQQKPVIANYHWIQRGPDSYWLQISAALRAVVITINAQPGKVTLTENGKKPLLATSSEQLIKEQLGWKLPVSAFKYWLRALPAKGKYTAQYDRYGHIQQLQQQGWRILYSHYQSLGRIDLPRMLRLSYHRLKVKWVIKHWTLNP